MTGGQPARPKLFVFSAPSGCGKTTIAHEILRRHPDFIFSVSATTRPKRENETDGKDYFFLSPDEFRRRIDAGEFVEWEEFFGNRYGTLHSEIKRALAAGRSMVFDIDVKGGLSIKRLYAADAVTIFIDPPSLEVLRQRLINRGTEDNTQLDTRLKRAAMEMEEGKKFDIHVVNDVLATAVDDVDAIIQKALTPANS